MSKAEVIVGVIMISLYFVVGFIFMNIGIDKCPVAEENYEETRTECSDDFICGWYLGATMWFGIGWIVVSIFWFCLVECL